LAVGLAEGLFARNRHRYRHALGKPTADCTVSACALHNVARPNLGCVWASLLTRHARQSHGN
jgi:hypothetical protein